MGLCLHESETEESALSLLFEDRVDSVCVVSTLHWDDRCRSGFQVGQSLLHQPSAFNKQRTETANSPRTAEVAKKNKNKLGALCFAISEFSYNNQISSPANKVQSTKFQARFQGLCNSATCAFTVSPSVSRL